MQYKDISNFIVGNINYYSRKKGTPQHIREQILYRMLKCSSCVLNKKCHHCGCATPKLFFAPHKEDPNKKWPPYFSSPKDWEATKPSLKLEELQSNNSEIVKVYNKLWI